MTHTATVTAMISQVIHGVAPCGFRRRPGCARESVEVRIAGLPPAALTAASKCATLSPDDRLRAAFSPGGESTRVCICQSGALFAITAAPNSIFNKEAMADKVIGIDLGRRLRRRRQGGWRSCRHPERRR